MAELLLELLSEEIPARMQARAATDLERLITKGLEANALGFEQPRSFVTPRRLVFVCGGIPDAQADVHEERRGPRVGAPAQAVEGFCRSAGVARVDLEAQETPKGTFYMARIHKAGRAAADVIRDVVEEALRTFPWPKAMRWGAGRESWVRPLHSIVCLLDGNLVPLSFAGVTAGAETVGHRFLAPAPFVVTGFDDYQAKLEAAHVILEPDRRAAMIWEAAGAQAARHGVVVQEDPGLLAEVAGLVEHPTPLLGRIPEQFMTLPPEVLTTSMRSHQKYFATRTPAGALAPYFIAVANTAAPKHRETIVAGYERVLRARLHDALFFWQEDLKEGLDAMAARLKDRVFYEGLGTMADKVERIERLAEAMAPNLGADPALVKRAVRLCKADLMSGMVGEFPELQGIMGSYYAEKAGEDRAVVTAIRHHYKPLGPKDEVPQEPVSVALTLADKFDSLAGFWCLELRPTGSGDPLALRRAALGVIRTILNTRVRPALSAEIGRALDQIGDYWRAAGDLDRAFVDPARHSQDQRERRDQYIPELLSFFHERLRVQQREAGVRHDLLDAVITPQADDLMLIVDTVQALGRFLDTAEGADLLAAYRRAMNIVRAEAKKDGGAVYDQAPDQGLLAQDEEQALFQVLQAVDGAAQKALEEERLDDAIRSLAGLRAPLDAFFDAVTVNADDPALRRHRLALLSHVGEAMHRVADFSKIEG